MTMGRPHFSQISSGRDILDLDALALHVLLGLFQALFKALVKSSMVLTQSAWPASTTSSFFSMSALNFTLHDIGELLHHDRVDGLAERVVFSFFWSFST